MKPFLSTITVAIIEKCENIIAGGIHGSNEDLLLKAVQGTGRNLPNLPNRTKTKPSLYKPRHDAYVFWSRKWLFDDTSVRWLYGFTVSSRLKKPPRRAFTCFANERICEGITRKLRKRTKCVNVPVFSGSPWHFLDELYEYWRFVQTLLIRRNGTLDDRFHNHFPHRS